MFACKNLPKTRTVPHMTMQNWAKATKGLKNIISLKQQILKLIHNRFLKLNFKFSLKLIILQNTYLSSHSQGVHTAINQSPSKVKTIPPAAIR